MAPKIFNPGDVLAAADVMKYLQNWWNQSSFTTDSSGHNTITHSAGFTPSVVIATPVSGGSPLFISVLVSTITSTTFTVRCFDNTGAAINTQALVLNWVALP